MRPLPSAFPKAETLFYGVNITTIMFVCSNEPCVNTSSLRNLRRIFTKIDY